MVKSLDVLKKSNEEFGTDLASIQNTLYQVAPASKALGLSFEETNGILNMMAKSGLDAGSSLQAFTYAAKNVESPEEFKKMLADIQAIKDPTEKAQKAVELFGSRAGVAMANVLDGSKNLDDFIVTMQQAEGTVASASSAFDNNLNVQIDLAKKMFSGLAQELGEKFMPVVNSILTWVTENLPKIVGYVENAINVIGTILQPFITLIKFIMEKLNELDIKNSATFNNIKDIIFSVVDSIQNFVIAFMDLIKKFWNAWGEDIINFTMVMWENIKVVFESTFNIIKGLFDFFTALFKGDWEGMGEALKSIAENFWNLIKSVFETALEGIKLVLEMAISAFKNLAELIMTGLWDGFKYIWESITDWFSNIFTSLFGWLDELGEGFFNIGKTMLSNLWNGMKDMWSDLKDWVGDTVSWLKDKLMFWKKSKNEMDKSDISSTTKSNYIIPKYDVGTPFVPNDQLAFVHRGEAIIPAKYNPFNSQFNKKSTKNTPTQTKTENHFHINKLEFPNVRNSKEIEEAIINLPRIARMESKK